MEWLLAFVDWKTIVAVLLTNGVAVVWSYSRTKKLVAFLVKALEDGKITPKEVAEGISLFKALFGKKK